jgi:hypothetical protein
MSSCDASIEVDELSEKPRENNRGPVPLHSTILLFPFVFIFSLMSDEYSQLVYFLTAVLHTRESMAPPLPTSAQSHRSRAWCWGLARELQVFEG